MLLSETIRKRRREAGAGEGHSEGRYGGVQHSFSPADERTHLSRGYLPGARKKQRKEDLLLSAPSWILGEVLFLLCLFCDLLLLSLPCFSFLERRRGEINAQQLPPLTAQCEHRQSRQPNGGRVNPPGTTSSGGARGREGFCPSRNAAQHPPHGTGRPARVE